MDDNQDLVAYGLGNLVSGFFSCFPAATAPPRTMILSSLGAKTTLNGVPTAVFMLLVILVIGQLFVSLPLSVLAAMIIVSMKDLLLQYRNLPTLWKVNKYDFIIWTVTNAVGVLVDLNYGLFAGIGVSILLVVVQSQLTLGRLLVGGQSEDVFVDNKRAKAMGLPHRVKVFQFSAGLYFATAERFKSQLYKMVLNPQVCKKQEQKRRKKINYRLAQNETHIAPPRHGDSENDVSHGTRNEEGEGLQIVLDVEFDHVGYDYGTSVIIIDCSSMNYIDVAGKNTLTQIIREYRDIGVEVRLADVPEQGRAVLEAAKFFDTFPRSLIFFKVRDAVESVKTEKESVYQSSA